MAKEIKVAIQGGAASFHDTAARQYFAHKAVEILPCESFRQLCDTLEQGDADFAVMAIENALAGSILTNYNLLQEHSFSIIGELWLAIDQNLIVLPGQQLQDITTVSSHPVALLQCGNFLKQYPHIQTQEATDTANSVRIIKENKLEGVAAIASKQAALLYGMDVLEENIADREDNFTRFLVLSKEPIQQTTEPANKASLILQLPLLGGSLGAVINRLHTLQLHVSQIQTIPAPVHNTCQNVAIDLECNDRRLLQVAIEELRPLVQALQVLGLYHTAPNPVHEELKFSFKAAVSSLNLN